ncbi:MAG: DNA polymerase III subunit delta, partial [Verrucomicrobiota bacterium]
TESCFLSMALTSAVLVISGAKADKRATLYKTCKELGEIAEFMVPEKGYQAEEEARQWAGNYFKQQTCRISPDAMEAFLRRTGVDHRQVVLEGDKLVSYVGDRKEITVDDVQAIVTAAKDALAWDLTDAIGSRNLKETLRILRRLLAQKESEVGLIIALGSYLKQLQIFRECLDQGWVRMGGSGRFRKAEWANSAEADMHLTALDKDPRDMHSFRASKLIEQAGRYRGRELRRFRAKVLQVHEKMVSTQIPPHLLLDFLVVDLIRK